MRPTFVHEAPLKLVGLERMSWRDRQHFFAVAAQAMRRVLVDQAVARKTRKRGAGRRRVELDDTMLVSDDRLEDVLVLDDALERLAPWAPRAARSYTKPLGQPGLRTLHAPRHARRGDALRRPAP